MSTYKVLQDIEAEDKFLGPLTLKQFIYIAIAIASIYISVVGFTKGTWVIGAVFSPVILFCLFLGWPWGKDQPTEIWLLAKVRYFLKPRRRIWDQSGIQELVTITAPKRIERQLTNGLSQTEVKSRLQALANTIDSRGWAIKNVNVNLFSQPSYVLDQNDSDRLIDPTTIPQDVPAYDVTPMDDVLDEKSSPTAQHFNEMITTSTKTHRQEAMDRMQAAKSGVDPGAQPNYWFMSSAPQPTVPGTAAFASPSVVAPGATADPTSTRQPSANTTTAEEQALLKQIHAHEDDPDPTNYHLRVVEPVSFGMRSKHHRKSNHPHTKSVRKKAQPTSTATPDAAILELANNDDLNVATIARQADKVRNPEPPEDEVVINLH
jgi:hypothetical protein